MYGAIIKKKNNKEEYRRRGQIYHMYCAIKKKGADARAPACLVIALGVERLLQGVAVSYSVLQRVVVLGVERRLHGVAVSCSALQRVIVCCSVLQGVAVCVLQCVAERLTWRIEPIKISSKIHDGSNIFFGGREGHPFRF